MSDKPFVQQDLASRLALLTHSFSDPEDSLLFLKAFFATIQREWVHIDRLRLDKFLSLIRRFTEQAFKFLHNQNWDPDFIRKYNDILSKGPLNHLIDLNGVRNHLCDVFIDSLWTAIDKPLGNETFELLLEPFFEIFKKSPNKLLTKRAFKRIFQYLQETHSEKINKFPSEFSNLLASRFFCPCFWSRNYRPKSTPSFSSPPEFRWLFEAFWIYRCSWEYKEA